MPQKTQLGWREWLGLPELGLPRIKAKIDTGARTSALHAFQVATFTRDGDLWVSFSVHPRQGRSSPAVECEARVLEQRSVRDSGGHEETRYVIETLLEIGGLSYTTELTLTNRDNMRFRMLLGRTAMRGRYTVDPGRSYLLSRKPGAKDGKRKRDST